MLNTNTVAHCLSLVAAETGIPRDEILNHAERRDRNGPISKARALVCWLARRHTGHSYPRIGKALDMDHSSVIHACRRAEIFRARYPEFRHLSDRCDLAWSMPPSAGLLSAVAP